MEGTGKHTAALQSRRQRTTPTRRRALDYCLSSTPKIISRLIFIISNDILRGEVIPEEGRRSGSPDRFLEGLGGHGGGTSV